MLKNCDGACHDFGRNVGDVGLLLLPIIFGSKKWTTRMRYAGEALGERIDSYNPFCVTHISAKSPDGTAVSIARTNEKERVVFTAKEKPAIVLVTSEWGDRVNTTRGKKLINRQAAEAAGLNVVSAFTSTQFSKTMFAPLQIQHPVVGIEI